MDFLFRWGWEPHFEMQLEPETDDSLQAARVVEVQKNKYRLESRQGPVWAELPGRFFHETGRSLEFPAVGDWVLADLTGGTGMISRLLRRKSALVRGQRDSNRRGDMASGQVLAANVDTVFITAVPDSSLSPNRIDRYCVLARGAQAWPVLLLTKSDLADTAEDAQRELERTFPQLDIIRLSAMTGEGISGLEPYLSPGRTVIVLGPSGSGKSTLINRLIGRATQATGSVREGDSKGRHTTTSRRLFRLPGGGLIIDTPGLRAIGLPGETGGVQDVFQQVELLAAQCRFADCSHQNEPGCAVLAAIESKELSPERLESYLKLAAESARLELRRDKAALNRKGKEFARMAKEVKQLSKRRFERS